MEWMSRTGLGGALSGSRRENHEDHREERLIGGYLLFMLTYSYEKKTYFDYFLGISIISHDK
jgi:hypothetical protein